MRRHEQMRDECSVSFVKAGGIQAGRATRAAFLLVLVAPLTACGLNKVYAPADPGFDYRDRHPVVLAEASTSVELLPQTMGRALDSETRRRLLAFVSQYRRFGHGMITMLAPSGGPDPRGARRSVELIRAYLEREGLGATIYVGSYPVRDPALAAPIRLSFTGVKAEVAGPCGEWPDDLASGASLDGWQNRAFWNFGCANEATLSAQLADPRDLLGPRGETPQDIETRMRAINKVRAGADPSTGWATKSGAISGVGG
jgi:pilus assembly protein CpaD